MPAKPSKTDIGSSTVASWATLASKYQDEGRYREAIRLYLKTLELEPTRSIETTLGALYELLEETTQALAEQVHLVAEPSGAVTLAALKTEANRFAGKTVAAVISGGNLDLRSYQLGGEA